ncbi:MAG: osmoprotectant transport system substrate-binding protein opuBD [Solirubrobacteraceae bacterium]|nr:osmoprotectant transport system substrate-binding protein opuBD [Solirubrobacteraceae bacterium]
MTLPRKIAAGAVAAAISLFAVGCGSSDSGSSSSGGSSSGSGSSSGTGKYAGNLIKPISGAAGKGTITIGSKNFTEQFILGNIYADALKAAGFNVKKQLNLGAEQIAYKALKAGRIDAYPEYTGTSLTSFFGVKVADVPRDKNAAYQEAKKDYAKVGITALPPTPFENTYRLGLLKKNWQSIGSPKTMSELAKKAGQLTITGYPECAQRTDCLLGVEKTYNTKFKKFLASNQTYQVLDTGKADVGFLFSTDGPLASGKYAVVQDDKHLFPPYNISFGIRNSALKKLGPQGQKVIEDVQKYMTVQNMQQLNARVDINKSEPDAVAQEYLKSFGFVK